MIGSLVAISAASAMASPQMSQAVVNEIQRSLVKPEGSKLCTRVIGKTYQRLNVYTEASKDIPPQLAQDSATANAGTVREILGRHGVSVPAYVEVASPKRWYGLAVYDNRSQRVLWFRCTSHCEQLGTSKLKRCR